jgi:hypothetical protein
LRAAHAIPSGLLEGEQLELAPRYLPLLRQANRELLAHELLQLLTQRLTVHEQSAWMLRSLLE